LAFGVGVLPDYSQTSPLENLPIDTI
jgi:hypothetical protein